MIKQYSINSYVAGYHGGSPTAVQA